MFQKLLPYTLRSGPEWFLSVITDLSNCYQGSEGNSQNCMDYQGPSLIMAKVLGLETNTVNSR